MEITWDVIVVGGGVAGLAAALTLARARRSVLVIDAGAPRNRFADHMHGVLGHEGLDPADLLARGREEVAAYGVVLRAGEVTAVETTDDGVVVTMADGAQQARALVVATGVADDLPPIPGLAERWGRTVLHCPYCHGLEVADHRLGVLLTSAAGWPTAALIRQWSESVVVFHADAGDPDPMMAAGLAQRDVRLVRSPVVGLLGESPALTGVRTADGHTTEVDALFCQAIPRPRDRFLDGLDLARQDTPYGSFLQADRTGATGHPRIWAVGNVVDPSLDVPMSIGAGSLTGGAVNWALVQEEVRGSAEEWPEVSTPQMWESRYAARERVWTTRPNAVLVDVAAPMVPGRALDLGCGEGADVVWLAGQGWQVTGVDVSATAVSRATDAARLAGLDGRARFVVGDLSALPDGEVFDLVTSSFLHSTAGLPRLELLRLAAGRVAAGGHLLITSHAAPPPWAQDHHGAHRLRLPQEELSDLAPDPASWQTVLVETRERQATDPDGQPATALDGVILLRRI